MPPVRCSRRKTAGRSRRSCSVSRGRDPYRPGWAGTRPARANRTCRVKVAWTVSFMQLWKNLISIFLCFMASACGQTPPAFVVRSAALDAGALAVRLEWRPDARVLEALDHGIALGFD